MRSLCSWRVIKASRLGNRESERHTSRTCTLPPKPSLSLTKGGQAGQSCRVGEEVSPAKICMPTRLDKWVEQ